MVISTASFGRWLMGAIAGVGASFPGAVWADSEAAPPASKAECAEVFEESQRLRNSSQYLAAAAAALRCTSAQCGALLVEECGKLYSEIQAATPSVVFGARSEDGKELADVSVRIDGARDVSLDGTPVLLDPGTHEFTFTADGFEPSKQTVVLMTGERFRPLVGVLPQQGVSGGEQQPSAPAGKVASDRGSGPPLASYVLGGVAVIGFGGFVGFRVAGSQQFDRLERDCKPACTQQDVDSVRQKYVLSYVGLAVGGAASIAAVTWYFAGRDGPPSRSAALSVQQLPGGVAARFSTRF